MRAFLRSLIPCLALVAACTPDPSASTTDAAKSTKTTASPNSKAGDEAPAPEDMIEDAPGVDLSKLAGAKREAFFVALNTEASACGKPHSLAVSLRDDGECRDSIHLAQFIADRLVAGARVGDIKAEIDALVAALVQRDVPTDGRPTLGNERAPVTVVVFADFQCPMCKGEAPELREAVEASKGRAKLVFKHFPLTNLHPRGEAAARAAEAAFLQGRFWEMHDQLFAHQEQLEDADLEGYAAQIGIDVEQFKADIVSEEVKEAVAQDVRDGETLGLTGTPTVYVNGREPIALLWDGELGKWIEDALKR